MKQKHCYGDDPIFVTTQEIKEGLKEGMSKKAQMECFDISSETYDKLKKGIIDHARLGKKNGVVDLDEELAERKLYYIGCHFPVSKCTCGDKK